MATRIKRLQEKYQDIPFPILLKNELLFYGVRYTPELGGAGEWAIPNYQPYRFQKGEENPTGKEYINIPYLITLAESSLVRVFGNGQSPYRIVGNRNSYLLMEDDEEIAEVAFQERPHWQWKETRDATPMSQIGISQHGDMLIVNPTPGCEYFLYQDAETGESYRCIFCRYGAPDQRTRRLGQEIHKGVINPEAIERVMEVCEEALPEITHIYLVGGSMVDIDEEARRYIQLAEAVEKVNHAGLPVCCGSSSLKKDALLKLSDAGVSGVCFNLEVWDIDLWKKVCPGKERFVGREHWIQGLIEGVEIFGKGNVMSAFVAGVEFIIDKGLQGMEDTLESCLQGTEWLLQQGILPIYSLQWPPTSITLEDDMLSFFQDYFLRLNMEQFKLRKKYNLTFPNNFVCHRCTYMQLECDFDHFCR